jgi:hypothetical protein
LRTEALRAVRHLGPAASRSVRTGLQRVDLIGIDDRMLDSVGILEPRVLCTLDAIHVASALAIGDDLDSLVAYDERMLAAARMVGLPTATLR